jgi:hypothetical protein
MELLIVPLFVSGLLIHGLVQLVQWLAGRRARKK